MSAINVMHLAAGGGGSCHVADALGFNNQLAVEINEYRQAILAQNWPNMAIHPNLESDYHVRHSIDIAFAGPPCPKFSRNGRGLGSNLWPAALVWIIKYGPSVILLENSERILSVENKPYLNFITDTLHRCGFNMEWDVFTAHETGAQHKRARFFLFAYTNRDGLDRARLSVRKGQDGVYIPARLDRDTAWDREAVLFKQSGQSRFLRNDYGLADWKHRISMLGDGWCVPQAIHAFGYLSNRALSTARCYERPATLR